MVLCLGKHPRRFLWCWLSFWSSFHFCIFILLLFFICRFSSFCFQATLPCHWHSTLTSQAHEGLHQLWALLRLLLIAFSFSSTASATVLSGSFLPTDVFYLALLHQHFNLHLYKHPWDPEFFLEACRTSNWSLKYRPDPSVCLIHSNPQSFIHLKFVFIHVNIAKVLLVVKTLIKKINIFLVEFLV